MKNRSQPGMQYGGSGGEMAMLGGGGGGGGISPPPPLPQMGGTVRAVDPSRAGANGPKNARQPGFSLKNQPTPPMGGSLGPAAPMGGGGYGGALSPMGSGGMGGGGMPRMGPGRGPAGMPGGSTGAPGVLQNLVAALRSGGFSGGSGGFGMPGGFTGAPGGAPGGRVTPGLPPGYRLGRNPTANPPVAGTLQTLADQNRQHELNMLNAANEFYRSQNQNLENQMGGPAHIVNLA